MKWVLSTMANNLISDEELKSILETREIKYKLDRNEWIAKGETNAKIEAVINLIKKNEYYFGTGNVYIRNRYIL